MKKTIFFSFLLLIFLTSCASRQDINQILQTAPKADLESIEWTIKKVKCDNTVLVNIKKDKVPSIASKTCFQLSELDYKNLETFYTKGMGFKKSFKSWLEFLLKKYHE